MNGGMLAKLMPLKVSSVPKKTPKLTRTESLALATAAHRLPEGTIGRQYQIVLPTLAIGWFLALSSKERGAIVEAGMLAVKAIEVDKTMEN